MGESSRVAKTNLDYYKKNQLLWVFTGALTLFIVCVIIAATAAPKIFDGKTLDYNLCKSSGDSFCFNYFRTENYAYFNVKLSPQNQIFYLQLDFYSKTEIDEEIKYDLFIMDSVDYRSMIYREENKTIRIRCTKGECDSELIFYIPYLKDNEYTVDLRLYGLIPVDSMAFKIRYISKEFTQFFLVTKYFFLALSILAIAYFAYNLCYTKFRSLSTESKFSGFMLLSLFVFNEPFLYLTLSKMTYNWTAFSIFCNFQFVASIIIFWFQILKKDFKLIFKISTSIAECLIVCAFFIIMCVAYGLTIKEQKKNPTFSWEYDLPDLGKKIFITGLSLLIILSSWMVTYIGFSITKLIQSLRNEENFTIKKSFMVIFVYFMIVITFLFIGIGAFQPVPRSGTLLLACVSFFNILLILLSWVYTPSRKANRDSKNDGEINERNKGTPANGGENINLQKNNKNIHKHGHLDKSQDDSCIDELPKINKI